MPNGFDDGACVKPTVTRTKTFHAGEIIRRGNDPTNYQFIADFDLKEDEIEESSCPDEFPHSYVLKNDFTIRFNKRSKGRITDKSGTDTYTVQLYHAINSRHEL